ncbi:MAG: long-chain fatty acid--CoA ligase [Myxococcota bacterium]
MTTASPIRSHYVTDWLARRAALSPDAIAVIDAASGAQLTFAGWNRRVNQTAHFLAERGVTRGDRVSVLSGNCVEYLDLLFACGKLGAILHNLNWRLAAVELAQIIADAEPTVLVYAGAMQERIAELAALDPDPLATIAHVISMAALDQRLRLPDSAPPAPELTLDDPWAIFYTGGTTGLPKGAILSHGNMTWNSVNTVTSWGIRADHCAPLQLPLFHVGGPNIFMLPMVHAGATTIVCNGFDIDQTFDLIDSGRITHYIGVPTMYIVMQQHPRWASADLSRLELVISGGAPCPRPVMEAFWQRGIDFKTGYGLTEATGNNFWLPPEEVRRKPGSVGAPLMHIDIRIAGDDGHPCPPGQAGQLLIRGPHVMTGYWRRPEATAAVIKDGWLHTGDLATIDDDGHVSIIGRSKEMFISGGENVYPAEIESALHAHPAVVEAALIAVPHPKWGEVGHAYVVLSPDAAGASAAVANATDATDATGAPDADQLVAFLRTRLASYKIPHSIDIIDELPKTPIGKLDKKQLVARHTRTRAAAAIPGPT